jgi:hypothetical protein
MTVVRVAAQSVLALILLPGVLPAQLPAARLDGIFPAGATPGATFDLTITGNDLDDADKLHFSHPGITAARKMVEPGPFDEGPQPVLNQFIVTVAGDVPAGLYEVRAQGKYGITNPRTFEVGSLAEVVETEPNNTLSQAAAVTAPVVVNGQINGATDVDHFRLAVKSGQRLLVSCAARTIDSPLDAEITISDESGRLLAEGMKGHDGEAVVDLAATADGIWLVRITDAVFRGGPQYVYRLTIGPLPYIDYVFPPAAVAGTNTAFTLFGRNLPGGQPSGLSLDGRSLEKLDLQIGIPGNVAELPVPAARLNSEQAGLDFVPYRFTGPGGASNWRHVAAARAPVVLEAADNETPQSAQKLTLPCEVAGQFYPQRDRDWFQFDARQGEVVNIELYSQRLGPPTDAALLIQQVTKNDAGQEQMSVLARVDDITERPGGYEFDTRTTDPAYRFTAPADGTYRILVQEGFSALHSDPRLVYGLVLRPDQPDFRLAAVPSNASGALFLRKGGRDTIRVVAFRRDGFTGDIRVSASGLPEGVTSNEVLIGSTVNTATLVLTATENAPPRVGQVQIVGKATIGDQEVARVARCGTALVPSQMMQPGQQMISVPARLTSNIMVGVSELETDAVLLSAGGDQVWETSRGGILKIPYTVVRRGEFKGNITGMPTDLPANINAQQFNIDGNASSGEFQINFTSNAPTGTYTFYVGGFVQGLQYKRNPEAAAAAAERKAKFEKIMAETAEKSKVANEEAAKTKQALDTANAELKTATDKKTAADKAVADADTEAKNAAAAAEQAKKAAAEKPDDAGLKTAAENADKAAAAAAAKLKPAQDDQAAAQKAFEEAQVKQKGAEEAKTKADMAAQAAQALAQQAQQLKQQSDQFAQQKQNEANPRGVNYWAPSTPVTIRIVDFPITVEGPPGQAAVKQGAMLELPVKVTRLYGFDQQVNFQLNLPGGVGGIGIQNFQVPNGQTDGKFVLNVQPNATVGTHNLTVRVQMNWNGQNLQFDRPVALTVEEVKTP